MMLAAKRQSRILERIQEQGSVQVEDLARDLGVSPMTIRRDLIKLQEENKVERCHGGAVAKQEEEYTDKQFSHHEEKAKLAQACLSFVSEGDSVFLDAGTTTFEIAKLIKTIPNILVVTNDLEIAHLLKQSNVELIVCGGLVQKSTGSMLGYFATQMLEVFHFDVGFFGAASINSNFEVQTPTADKAFLKRQVANRCAKSYLVVDQSKFNKQSLLKINDLGTYTGVVTDFVFSEEDSPRLKKLGAKIIFV